MKFPLADLGKETEKGVVSALNDLFGPSFREVGEFLADKVKYHRAKSLEKIFNRAKTLRVDVVEFTKIPPLKFFVPFIEDASLEDPEDEELCTIWAKLLLQASENCDSEKYLFKRIIKEITSREAKLLRAMVCESRSIPRPKGGSLMGYASHRHDTPYEYKSEYIERFLGELINSGVYEKDIAQSLIHAFESSGSHIHYIQVARGVPGVWPIDEIEGDRFSSQVTDLFREYESSFYVLEGLNIISDFRCGPIWIGGLVVEMHIYYLNKLGCAFYDTCVDDDI